VADFGNIPNPSAFTFNGWFKFDKLTDNKNYPLISVKTVNQVNVDPNLTTYKDLFNVSFDKSANGQFLKVDHLEGSSLIKSDTLQYTPLIGQWFNLTLTFDYKLNKGQLSVKDQ
jgi:hypothetical protein